MQPVNLMEFNLLGVAADRGLDENVARPKPSMQSRASIACGSATTPHHPRS